MSVVGPQTPPASALSPRALRERLSPRRFGGGLAPIAPWTPEALARLLGLNCVGLVLIVTGWYQASGQLTVRAQLTWLNVGLVGVGVAGFANGTWLLRGRQAIGLAAAATLPLLLGQPGWAADLHGREDDELVSGPGMSRYHRRSCQLAAGRAVSSGSRARFDRSGLAPCEVCEP